MTESKRIGILLFLYTRNELTTAEREELLTWRRKDPEHEKLFFQMTDPDSLRSEMQTYYKERDREFEKLKLMLPELAGTSLTGTTEEAINVFSEDSLKEEDPQRNSIINEYSTSGLSPVDYWGSMISNLDDEVADEGSKAEENPVVKMKPRLLKNRWQRRIFRTIVGMAAIWVSGMIYFNFFDNSREESEAVMISPKGFRALKKGFDEGYLAGFADVSIGHTERGELINIVRNQPKKKKDKYYPLITLPAEELLVLLPDGTRVWMNALSSIRYPANFDRDTVTLELDGEAFVEVSKNSPHNYLISRFPYSIIDSNGNLVKGNPASEILQNGKRAFVHALPGVRLNFSTYPGNREILVTLISGLAVKLDSAGDGKIQLMAGQQLLLKNDLPTVPNMIDTTEVIAWAKGEFNFRNAPVQNIARELERWYDISVVYHGKVPEKGFTLQIPRSTDIKTVQNILEKQGIRSFRNRKDLNFYF